MGTRRSFLSTALLLGGAAGAAWWLRDEVFWPVASVGVSAEGGSSGWLPFANDRLALPTVRARLAGATVTALIDSGAQTSVIDAALAERLALPPALAPPLVAFGLGGAAQAGRGADLTVGLGALTLDRVRAAVLALGPLAEPEGADTPLVLGQDVLSAVVAEIDFPRRRLRLSLPGREAAPEGAVAAPVRRRGRALTATVRVEGAAVETVIDTGASAALSLSSEAAAAAGLMDGRPTRPASSLVLGGVSRGLVLQAGSMQFAGPPRGETAVHVFPDRPLPGFPEGLLGVGALEDFRVVLDHAGGRMLLAPA